MADTVEQQWELVDPKVNAPGKIRSPSGKVWQVYGAESLYVEINALQKRVTLADKARVLMGEAVPLKLYKTKSQGDFEGWLAEYDALPETQPTDLQARVTALEQSRDSALRHEREMDGELKHYLRRNQELIDRITALETALRLMFMDLQLSYVREHQVAHITFVDGEAIEFKDCSIWTCKNHREKLAEWQLTMTELLGEQPR